MSLIKNNSLTDEGVLFEVAIGSSTFQTIDIADDGGASTIEIEDSSDDDTYAAVTNLYDVTSGQFVAVPSGVITRKGRYVLLNSGPYVRASVTTFVSGTVRGGIEFGYGVLPYPPLPAVSLVGTDEDGNEVEASAGIVGTVVSFTGDLTLSTLDVGKIFRCDDATDVTVTVPADLPVGFNVGVAQWGVGTVTFAAGTDATNRSSSDALSGQYGVGSVLVIKAGEFVLGGDVA